MSREEDIDDLLQHIWDSGPGFNRDGSDYNPQILRVLILIAAELAALNDTLKERGGQ